MALLASTLVASGFPSPSEAPAQTSAFPGWNSINKIYFDPDEDTGLDAYLADGTADLEKQLESVRPDSFVVTTTPPSGAAVRVRVQRELPAFANKNDNAFRLVSDETGITITGKTPLAARHGIYAMLHVLGFRWFFPHPAWEVVPAYLAPVSFGGAVQAPPFKERSLVTPMGFLTATDTGREATRLWNARNRMTSTETYRAYHSWEAISPLEETARESPSAVCYNANGTPRNLRPSAPLVVDRAKRYGYDYFRVPTLARELKMAAPIDPEDGAPKCPEWTRPDGTIDTQKATDGVIGLANEVARHLQATRPGKYAGVMSYNVYSEVPMIPLEPNLYVEVATDFGTVGTDKSFSERLAGFKSKGVMTGVYEWFNVWQYTHDRPYGPGAMKNKLQSIATGASGGATVFNSEAGNNWGPKGRAYWLASRLLWKPNTNTDLLLNDFYSKAFGPAQEPMKRYFHRLDTQMLTDRVYGLSFRDLDEALELASQAGDAKVADRIRQLVLYTYYDWRWGAGTTSGYPFNLEEMKALYSYVWRLTNLHLITVKPEKGVVSKRLRENFGLSDEEISQLENKTPPSASEVRGKLNEALGSWTGTLVDAQFVDPARLMLTASPSDKASTSASYGGWQNASVMVPSTGSETVTAYINCPCPTPQVVTWSGPDQNLITRLTVDSSCEVQACRFDLATTVGGMYRLVMPAPNMSVKLDRPAAHDLSENTTMGGTLKGLAVGPAAAYFHVPSGTASLVVGTGAGNLRLTSPSGAATVLSDDEYGVTNPQPGLWRVDLDDTGVASPRAVWLLGVPPLLWNNPDQLLTSQS